MTRAKSMYVRLWSIKTKKLQVHGTPCKCCSRSQQRSRPRLRLTLTARLVLIWCVWWLSCMYLITSFALDIWQNTFHTTVCVRRSCRPARYLSSSTHSHISKRCLASALRVSLNHYWTLSTKQRRGSKAFGLRKQCHEGSTRSSHVMTPLVHSCSSTCSSNLYIYF